MVEVKYILWTVVDFLIGLVIFYAAGFTMGYLYRNGYIVVDKYQATNQLGICVTLLILVAASFRAYFYYHYVKWETILCVKWNINKKQYYNAVFILKLRENKDWTMWSKKEFVKWVIKMKSNYAH